MSSFNSKQKEHYLNNEVGFVFQNNNLLNEFDVKYNVELPLLMQGKKNNQAKVEEVLTKVGLIKYINSKPNALSGGEQQRVAIARGIIKEPKILLLDEPTGNLDSVTSKEIFKLLKELSKERLIIVVTHDNESAYSFGTRIIKIDSGRIVDDNDPPIEKEENESFNNEIKTKHLPFKDIVKISFNEFFKTPLKTILALVICILSLGVASISQSIFFVDKVDLYVENYSQEIAPLLNIKKSYNYSIFQTSLIEDYFKQFDYTPKTSIDNVKISQSEIDQIENRFSQEAIPIANEYNETSMNDKYDRPFSYSFNTVSYFNKTIMDEYDFDLVYGDYPTNENEICLTLADFNDFVKIYDEYHFEYAIDSFDDIVDVPLETFRISDQNDYIVCGIIDCPLINTLIKDEMFVTYYDLIYSSNKSYLGRIYDSSIKDITLTNGANSIENIYAVYSGNHVIDDADREIVFENEADADSISLVLRRSDFSNFVKNECDDFAQDNYEKVKAHFYNYEDYASYLFYLGDNKNEYQEGCDREYFNRRAGESIFEIYGNKSTFSFLNSDVQCLLNKGEIVEDINNQRIVEQVNINKIIVDNGATNNYLLVNDNIKEKIESQLDFYGLSQNGFDRLYLNPPKNKDKLREIVHYGETGVKKHLQNDYYYFIDDEISYLLSNLSSEYNSLVNRIVPSFAIRLSFLLLFIFFVIIHFVIKNNKQKRMIGCLKTLGINNGDSFLIQLLSAGYFLLVIWLSIAIISPVGVNLMSLYYRYTFMLLNQDVIKRLYFYYFIYSFKEYLAIWLFSLIVTLLAVIISYFKLSRKKAIDLIEDR